MKIELSSEELGVVLAHQQKYVDETVRLSRDIAKLESNITRVTAEVQSYQENPNGKLVKVLTSVCACLANGQKINAIKIVREETNLGLKEAKDIVEGTYAPYRY